MIFDFTKLHNVLERIAVALEGGAKVDAAETAGPKRGRGRPAAGESTPPTEAQTANAQSAAAASTISTATAVTSAGAEKPVDKVPTLQQVADAIIDLANNVSRDKAVAILAKYNVKKVPELKPEQFATVLADVAAAKAPAASDSLV